MQLGDLTREADERSLNPMPVRVTLLHDLLIVVLGGFPTVRARHTNMKGSDVIGTPERGGE